jgi:biotin carboxyl carrier protein
MNKPIVRRGDFWGDFVNGLFFRPVARSVEPVGRETPVSASNTDRMSEEDSVSLAPRARSETISSILITEPLPDLDPDQDIEVSFANDALIIEAWVGETKVRTENRGRLPFSRRIPLPPEADPDARVMSYQNGVLMIQVPLRRPVSEPTTTEASGSRHNSGEDLAEPEYDVSLPGLGANVTEGTVTRWLKQVGDRVEAGEPLVEVSTDKVDTEIPSPIAGVIEEILVAEDETVEIGAPLVRIGPGAGSAEAAAPATESPRARNEKTAPSPQMRPGRDAVAREDAINGELSKRYIDTAGSTQVSERPSPRLPKHFGADERLVEELYERYERDKNTVDAKWWPLFESIDAGEVSSGSSASDAASPADSDTREER